MSTAAPRDALAKAKREFAAKIVRPTIARAHGTRYCDFATNDLAAAKAFHVDRLGFRVTFEASADGRTGLLGLQRGTIELTLDCPMEGHGRNASVSLHVTDADAYYREWSARVTPLRPPKDEEWGARTFDLLDPSGNTLFVIGPVR